MVKKLFIMCSFIVFSISVFAGALPTPNNFGGDFSLPSTLDKPASISEWKGKVVLLNFGFTSCPDVCPMVLSKLALVQNTLDKDAKHIQVLFVSVDPERDTLEKIQAYLKHYHPAFVGMRADSEAEVKAIMRKYGAALESVQTENGKDISHADYVYVINRQGYVAGFYDVKTSPQELLTAIRKLR